jgi:YkoP domain
MERRDSTHHAIESLLHGSVDRAVLAIDRSLRRAQGIFEYSDADDCILRIAVIPAETRILLPDGTQLRPEDPIVDLHLWNERVPNLAHDGSSLAWGAAFRTCMRASLRLLANYLASEPDLKKVKACRARVAFLRDRLVQRAARHLGFVSAIPNQSLPDHVHEFLEVFLIYGLTWVFNPDALPRKACLPQRSYLWMSRKELFSRYGSRPGKPKVAMIAARDKNLTLT